MAKTKKSSELSFEEAMEALDGIVQKLEKGDITLDESMKLFTEGMELSKLCSEKINSIEHQIVQLVKDSSGQTHEVELE